MTSSRVALFCLRIRGTAHRKLVRTVSWRWESRVSRRPLLLVELVLRRGVNLCVLGSLTCDNVQGIITRAVIHRLARRRCVKRNSREGQLLPYVGAFLGENAVRARTAFTADRNHSKLTKNHQRIISYVNSSALESKWKQVIQEKMFL